MLTKHLSSSEKLRQLVELYGCEYKGGRAETAPKLRTAASTKFTMADATEIQVMEETARMPHLEMSKSELDSRFPSLVAVPDDILIDAPEVDKVLEFGFKIAREIQSIMLKYGRSRREHVDQTADGGKREAAAAAGERTDHLSA